MSLTKTNKSEERKKEEPIIILCKNYIRQLLIIVVPSTLDIFWPKYNNSSIIVMMFIKSSSIRSIIIPVMMLGCIVVVGADATNSDSALSVSVSRTANPKPKRVLLDEEQSSATNVPLILQSSSPSPKPSVSSSGSENQELHHLVQQSFTQTLQIHHKNQSVFNNEELTRYELLMSSYTDNFGYNVSIPYILPSCQVTSQSLASFFGAKEEEVRVLTVAFTMGYYHDSSRYDGDYDIDNYPTLFQGFINSHLGVVTRDMQDHWILPVVAAQTVEVAVTTDAAAAAPTSTTTNSPVTTQGMMKEDANDTALSVVSPPVAAATTPTHAPTPLDSSSTNQFHVAASSSSSKPTSKSSSSHPSTTTQPMLSSQHSTTTHQSEPNNSSSTSSSSSSSPKQTYHVRSTMILDNISYNNLFDSIGELDPIAKKGWIQVTQDWIRNATMQFIGGDGTTIDVGSGDDDDVDVIISLDQYKVLDDNHAATTNNRSRMLSFLIQKNNMKRVYLPSKQFYYLRSGRRSSRGLVSQTTVPRAAAASVQLDFTSVLSFHSSTESWNADEIVASGFRSMEQKTKYIVALKNQQYWNQNDTSFDRMTMEVDGELITDKGIVPSPAIPAASTTTGSVVVSNANAAETESSVGLKSIYLYAIIITAVIALLLLVVFIHRKRSRKARSKKVSNTTHEEEGASDAESPINELGLKGARLDDSSALETNSGSMRFSTSNEVKHGNSAASTIRERQKGSVIETFPGSSTLLGFFSQQLLGDSEDRITVVAPSGKLGLVVSSSPSKDTMPMIVQIKNKSVLTRKVKVGDLLLSVDEVDCRGMTALEVSNLIASRCQKPERVFVLSRGL